MSTGMEGPKLVKTNFEALVDDDSDGLKEYRMRLKRKQQLAAIEKKSRGKPGRKEDGWFFFSCNI